MYPDEKYEQECQFHERRHPQLAPLDGRSAPPEIELPACWWCGKPVKVANPEPGTDYAHPECLAKTAEAS